MFKRYSNIRIYLVGRRLCILPHLGIILFFIRSVFFFSYLLFLGWSFFFGCCALVPGTLALDLVYLD